MKFQVKFVHLVRLVPLVTYELYETEGIVPDRWSAKSLEACQLVFDAYSKDYSDFLFKKRLTVLKRNVIPMFGVRILFFLGMGRRFYEFESITE